MEDKTLRHCMVNGSEDTFYFHMFGVGKLSKFPAHFVWENGKENQIVAIVERNDGAVFCVDPKTICFLEKYET